MRKIILSAMAILTIAATSCQKQNQTTKVEEVKKGTVMEKLDGGTDPTDMHNPICTAYYIQYHNTPTVSIDSVFQRVVGLMYSMYGVEMNEDTVQLLKVRMLSDLTSLSVIDGNGKFKSIPTVLTNLVNDEPDYDFKQGLISFTDSVLNAPTYSNSWITDLEHLPLTDEDAIFDRDGFASIFNNALNLYYGEDELFSAVSPQQYAEVDAAGYRFGAYLGRTFKLSPAGRGLLAGAFAVAFSSALYE